MARNKLHPIPHPPRTPVLGVTCGSGTVMLSVAVRVMAPAVA